MPVPQLVVSLASTSVVCLDGKLLCFAVLMCAGKEKQAKNQAQKKHTLAF